MPNVFLERLRNAHEPYRTRVPPHGPSIGRVGATLKSRSHPVFGAQGETPAGQPTNFTPWGTFVPEVMTLKRLRSLGPHPVTRSPGAYFTPPATYQLPGIPVPFSFVAAGNPALTRRPYGRRGTPPVRHFAIYPFPGARLPLPTNPPPSSFRGVIY